eukprot:TRINITY_DN7831_c0_g2_i2.p1 TRINITY_DN7831_c0_g2~~TRINITY_DN7831_c0_g2_i2.p1  ORF type:complete len:230 (+),score=31.82 TRINITY_DN7831_c0_g2_i2:80-691(+)
MTRAKGSHCHGFSRWAVIGGGVALCVVAGVLNILLWTVGMAVPVAVGGILDLTLSLSPDNLSFVAVLTVANTNRIPITLRRLSFTASIQAWNETILLGDVLIPSQIEVDSLVDKEERFNIDLALSDPVLVSKIERILLYEKFYFVTKGTAQVRTELYSYQVTLQGSEVFEKFNRTLIPNYIDMNQYRTERMNRLARIHQRGIS